MGPGLEIVEKIRLPLILPLRDLDQPYPREKFREDLKKDGVIRIDLFARDTAKATEAFQAILKRAIRLSWNLWSRSISRRSS